MLVKRLMALLVLVAGVVGVFACVAGAYPIWLLERRVSRTNERVFAILGNSLAAAQDRFRSVQERLRKSKTQTSEIAQKLRDWRTSATKERLASALDIQRRAEKLGGLLQAADDLLETSTEAIRGIQHVSQLCTSVGVPVDVLVVEKMLEELRSLQGRLQEAERSVTRVGDFLANRVAESDESRLPGILKFLSRAELTEVGIDSRLEASASRLSEMRAAAQQSNTRISRYILLAAIAAYLVLAWIAAGQAALCLCSWRTVAKADRRSGPTNGS